MEKLNYSNLENSLTETSFLELKLKVKELGLAYIEAYHEFNKIENANYSIDKVIDILELYTKILSTKRADLTALLNRILHD